jgi:hypothetical protein
MENFQCIHVDDPSEPMRQLLFVTPDILPTAWPHAKELLMEGGKYWREWATLGSIYENVLSRKKQLWLMNSETEFILGMLTEILNWPSHSELKILWMGGKEFDTGAHLFLDYIELWSRRQGVSKISLKGRKGWVRKLKAFDYELTEYVMTKDISGIREH